MKTQLLIIFLGLLVFTSCKEDNADWIFVEGGTFEQGKNQMVISPKGDTINGFTSPHRMVELVIFI